MFQDDIDFCVEFAEECVETNADEYARRNQNDLDKIVTDISIGKMGEIAVYDYLLDRGFSPSEPDFEIYAKHQKQHDYDISTEDFDVSVKTQQYFSADRFGTSWLFQKDYIDRMFDSYQDNHFLALCLQDEELIEILAIIPFDMALDFMSEPKLDKLRNNKYALYWDDIKHELSHIYHV